MRIAMLYTPLTTAGGAERQFFEELRQLRARGHDVSALTFQLRDEALFQPGDRDFVRVLRAGGFIGKVRALRAELRATGPDVLVSHTSPELTWLATRGSRLPYIQYHNSPPFYIGEDANPYMASWRYRRAYPALRGSAAGYEDFAATPRLSPVRRAQVELRTALKHRGLRGARAVVVPSMRTVRELRAIHGVEATVVRGCLPSSLLDGPPVRNGRLALAPDGGPVVLSVCRLEPVKRIDLLIRSFARARSDIPDATLVIAGSGSDERRLRQLVRESGLDVHVRFEGYVPEDRIWDYYAAADVLAAPAMADFVIAPYEAMAMGCRAVWTTEMETEPEIERSGQVFVARPDEESFASAIVQALRADGACRADLRSMTWERRGDRVEALLSAAAGRRMAA